MDGSIIKLPLFSKLKPLQKMPCHDRGRTFAITEAIRPQPQDSMGYLVEDLGGRRVKIIAWLALGGAVFACDAPLGERPDRPADAGMSKGEDDIFFFVRHDGAAAKTAHFSQRERDGRFTVTTCALDLGPYASGAYDLDEMAAACFLTHRAMPEERGEAFSVLTVGDILNELLQAPYPDALDSLVYRGAREGASAFERYASRSLVAAGSEYVRPIAAAHDVDLRQLGSTGLFWTSYDRDELVDREMDTLQAVEGALNRLVFMEHYLGDGSSPLVALLSEDQVARAAMRSLSHFAAVAKNALLICEEENPYLQMLGSKAVRGGEWDLRTRFAFEAERLRTPFCFEYDYDCDARAGVFSIEATVPAASAFPCEGVGVEGGDARTSYALRLSMVLAATAFGAGVGVIRAVVNIHERQLTGPLIASIAYSRQRFAMETRAKIQDESILCPNLAVSELIEQLDPIEMHMDRGDGGELHGVDPIAVELPARFIEMAKDDRAVPEGLKGLLHADVVSDLDIFSTADDPLRGRFEELQQRMQGGDASLVNELTDIVATYDAADAMQGDARRPLYCVNLVSRIAAGLDDPDVRFRKVPDSAFDARSALSRLYREQGNLEDAFAFAKELVELAPTSFNAYHSLALVFKDADMLDEAIAAILDGLAFASAPIDVAIAYYRLGFFYWQKGNPSLGLACYAMVPRSSQFFGAAQEEMGDLMVREHLKAPTRDEAGAMLRAEGVPIAPVPALVALAARASMGLVDAGFFDAAAPLLYLLAGGDVAPNCHDVLPAVVRSLR